MQTRRNRVRSASQARSPDLAGSSAQDAAVDSAMRTPEQTEKALFFSDNAVAQYQASMRGIAAERDLEVIAGGSFRSRPVEALPCHALHELACHEHCRADGRAVRRRSDAFALVR
jgi:hypothetical protein